MKLLQIFNGTFLHIFLKMCYEPLSFVIFQICVKWKLGWNSWMSFVQFKDFLWRHLDILKSETKINGMMAGCHSGASVVVHTVSL